MTLRLSPAVLATAALLAIAAGATHADVTITSTKNIDSPELTKAMQKATPEQRKMMAAQGYGKPQTVKTLVHGGSTRTDVGEHTTIINTTEHKALSFDRASHTYMGEDFNPKSPPAGTPMPKVSVKDTGKSATLLGHPVHIWSVSISPPQGPGSLTGEIWAAKDIPSPPFDPLTKNPGSPLQSEMKKVSGYPVKVVLHMKGPNGTSTMTQVATAISTQAVPASAFTVPSGYKKVTPPSPQQPQMMQPPHK